MSDFGIPDIQVRPPGTDAAPNPFALPVYQQPQAPAKPPSAFVQGYMQDEAELRDRQFMAYFADQMKRDPDLEAEARKLSVQTGLDRETVRGNVDSARGLLVQREMRIRDMARTSPLLRAALDDPEFASVAHDDLDNLSWWERFGQNFEAGQLETERGEIGLRMMRNPDAALDSDLERMVEIERRLDILPKGDSVVGMTGRVVGQMWETAPVTLGASAAASLVVGALTGGAGSAPAGVVTASIVGGYQAYEIEAGNAYRDYILAGMDRRLAVSQAQTVGIINALIEAGSLGVVGKPIASGARKVTQRLIQKRLAEVGGRSLRRAATQYALGVGAETGTEAIQEVVTAIGEKVGLDRTQPLRKARVGTVVGEFNLPGGGYVLTKEDGGLEVTPDVFERVTGKSAQGVKAKTIEMSGDVATRFLEDLDAIYPIEAALSDDDFLADVAALAFETAGHAIKGMWLPTLPGPVLDYAASRKRVKQAKVAAEQFEEMVAKAAESKLNKRDSAQFALHLKRSLQGKPFEKVYIDREELKAALSEAEVTVAEIDRVLPGVATQLKSQAARQPDVVYDGGQFIARLAEHPLLDVVKPHVRADRDAMSSKAAGAIDGELDTQAEELRKRLDEDEAVQAQFDASLDVLEETSRNEQVAAGVKPAEAKANAAMHRSAISALSRRIGIDPQEFLSNPELRLSTEQVDGQQSSRRLNAREVTQSPEFREWFGDSKVVDENGEPLVVYHGTGTDFDEFAAGGDHYFSDRADVAGGYAQERQSHFDVVDEWGRTVQTKLSAEEAAQWAEGREADNPRPNTNELRRGSWRVVNRAGRIIPARLSLQNPLVVDAAGQGYAEIHPEDIEGFAQDARDEGHDGVIVRNVLDNMGEFSEGASTVYVAFRPEQIKSVNNRGTFDGSDPSILRAADSEGVQGQFDPDKLKILLQKKHNATTWMHEFAHYWFELQGRLAREGRLPDQAMADLDTVAKWAGLDGVDDFLTAPPEQWRQAHEAFAYSFEVYLYENKAPSVELRNVFRRFAKWLVEAYASVINRISAAYEQETNGKKLPALTNEVRAVMDRMLATDEQIDARMQEEAIGQLLLDEELTAEQRQRLERLLFDAEHEAKEELRGLYMQEVRHLRTFRGREIKKLQKEARKVRKQVEAEEQADLLSTPLGRLQHWLKTGEELDEQGNPDPSGLLGAEAKVASDDRRWGRGKRSPEGLDEDFVAQVFGFESVEEMLSQLDSALPISEEVQARADERMMQEHSELLDQESIEQAVDAAVNNRGLMKLRAAEAKILDSSLPDQGAMIAAAREVARRIVGNLTVEELSTQNVAVRALGDTRRQRVGAPRSYSQAAARAERAAWIARGRGDVAEMRKQQRTAIQQRALAQEAYARLDQIKRGLQALQKRVRVEGTDREKYLGRAYGGDTISTVREMLAHFGLHGGARNRNDDGFAPWRNLGENDPLRAELELAYQFVTEQHSQEFGTLSVTQADDVIAAINGALQHGRRSKVVELEDRKLQLEDFVASLEQLADEQERGPTPRQQRTKWGEAGRKLSSVNATWQRIEPLLEAIDGGRAGVLTQTVWEPTMQAVLQMRASETTVLQRLEEALRPLRDAVHSNKAWTREITSQHLVDPQTGRNYVFRNGKRDVIGALLHSGNESNLRRLIGGYGWGDVNPETLEVDRRAWDAQVRAWEADGTVTEADWKVVQDIWAIYDELLPQTQAAHYEVLGHEMEVVDRGKVQTRWGEIRGGYVPAAAEPTLNSRAQEQKADAMLDWQRSIPAVTRGHTKSRVEGAYRALDLDPLRQANHFHQSLVFSHMAPQVQRLNRLLQNRDVRAMLERLEPDIYENYLNHWMQTVASQSTTLGREGDPFAGSTFLSTLRRSAGTAAMFGNVVNAAQNISGAVLAAAKVKPKFLALASQDIIRAPRETRDTIHDLSQYMRDRHAKGNTVYEVRDRIDTLRESSNKLVRGYQQMQRFLSRNTYWLQELTQKPLDRVVWLGAYKQEIERSGSESRAVAAGDAAVRQTQGDTLAVSLARGEKGSEFVKLFTQFSSWFVMMGSLRARAVRDPGDFMVLAAAAFPMLLSLGLGEVIGEMLRPGGDKDDDLDTTALRVMRNTAIALPRVAGLPGNVASAVVAALLDGDVYQQRMPAPPAISTLSRALSEGNQLLHGDEVTTSDAMDFAEAASVLLGLPVTPVTRRVRAGFGVATRDGEEEFSARGLLTGRR